VQRDLASLADTRFDVLVVGAGIYGAAIAWEAAHRGLSVALVDRGDFGSGTSFNSLKTVHGGLRSLQRGNLFEMRQFIRERRALFRMAPHLVQPLRFLIPTTRAPKRSLAAMRIALAVNDLVARDRNVGVDPALHLDSGRVIGLPEAQRLFPGLSPRDATGGATWHDGQMYNADRLVLGFVHSAARAGGAAANYVEVTGLLHEGNRVAGVRARDARSGESLVIRAAVTINTAGAWAADLTNSAGLPGTPVRIRLSKAVNLVTRCAAPPCAIGNVVDGRFLFSVPWRGVAVFGTLHTTYNGAPDGLRVTAAEAEVFLRDLNRAFPAARVSLTDIALVHQGLLPMDGVRNGEVQLSKHSLVRDHRDDGVAGLVTVVGVRYTTARHTAQHAVETAASVLGRTLRPSRSAVTPLVGGNIDDLTTFLASARTASPALPPPSLERVARSYGAEYPRVLSLIDADPALSAPLGSTCPVTGAEIVYAVREEMGVRLSDVLLRRTEAGSAGHPGEDAVRHAATLMARERGWDDAQRDAEIEAVEQTYRWPQG
jgi:glycerol-3-phosphate dehydrogenase